MNRAIATLPTTTIERLAQASDAFNQDPSNENNGTYLTELMASNWSRPDTIAATTTELLQLRKLHAALVEWLSKREAFAIEAAKDELGQTAFEAAGQTAKARAGLDAALSNCTPPPEGT